MKKDMLTLQELYKFICKEEGLSVKPLRFTKVGKGGACCRFLGKKVFSIDIDLYRISIGAAYALCHEVAHQILIEKEGISTHNRKFKNEEARLVKAYATCKIANRLIF